MNTLTIPTAEVFEPLLAPARYKGVYGGRGSGKSHFFGELLVETCQAEPGTLAVCIREAQRTLAQSSKRLIESKIASLGVGSGFKLFNDKIETPGDGLIIFRGMQDDLQVYVTTHEVQREKALWRSSHASGCLDRWRSADRLTWLGRRRSMRQARRHYGWRRREAGCRFARGA